MPNLLTSFHWCLTQQNAQQHAFIFGMFKKTMHGQCALVMVSCVVNVLDAIRKSVSSGVIFFNVFGNIRTIDIAHKIRFNIFFYMASMPCLCNH